jgi:hypothetical protein
MFLMKKCWDCNKENRPTVKEIANCLLEYRFYEKKEEIIKSDKIQRIINTILDHSIKVAY